MTLLSETIPPFLLAGVPTVLVSLSLVDPDAYSGEVSVRLVTSTAGASLCLGALPAAGPGSLAYQQLFVSFQVGSGYVGAVLPGSNGPRAREAVLEFSGRLSSLNRLLASVIYSPAPWSSGVERLSMWVSDNGHTCGAATATNPCTVNTDARVLEYTVPHREYPPRLAEAQERFVSEGSARALVALLAEDPNAAPAGTLANTSALANVTLHYFITDLTLQRVGSATASPPQMSWGALGRMFQYSASSSSNFGGQVQPASSPGAAFAPVAVSDPGGRLLLKLAPYFHGASLLSFRYTATKVVREASGAVTVLRAATNSTVHVRIQHVNHAPYVSNADVSTLSLSSSKGAVVFERDFFPLGAIFFLFVYSGSTDSRNAVNLIGQPIEYIFRAVQ